MVNVDNIRRDLMLLLVPLIVMQVDITDQLGQKQRIMNESRKTKENNNNVTTTTYLDHDVTFVKGHNLLNKYKQQEMKISVHNLDLDTASSKSSLSLLRDENYIFNHHEPSNKQHQNHYRNHNNPRYKRYRHHHSSHIIKRGSRQRLQNAFLSAHYIRNTGKVEDNRMMKLDNNVIKLDNTRQRRSSASHYIATPSFPSYNTEDFFETAPMNKERIMAISYANHSRIKASDSNGRDNAPTTSYSKHSMRIIRRDTNFMDQVTSLTPSSNFTWPRKQFAEISGHIMIGGLHMVHERENERICGPVMPQGGLQAAEVMLYTVDQINKHSVMPGGLQLGAYILDDCDTDTYGLQQAVDFIKGKKVKYNMCYLGIKNNEMYDSKTIQ